MGAGRPTARDVADRVGVSLSTVSLVINGKDQGRVSPQTRAAVYEAVAALGYRLNTTASALAKGQRDAIGFLSPDPTNPFFSMVLEGLARTLDSVLSLTVLVPDRGEDYDLTTVRRALEGSLAGLILASPGSRLLDAFVPTCPTVILDAGGAARSVPSLDLDVAGAARRLSAYLGSLGHRRVAYVGVSRDKASLEHRRDALREGLAGEGATLVEDLEVGELTIQDAARGFAEAWPRWSDAGVTAVVCGDDVYAYGVMRTCRELGVAIPEQLSVVGFGDLPYSELTAPGLTTVKLWGTELGVEAAALLTEFMRTGVAPASRVLETSLVIRGSTGPAPR
jgi:LacI family transcriptional regulator